MNTPALQTFDLCKTYKKSRWFKTETCALNRLNLEIFEGEIFGLLGLNGAGKTTTLKLFLGLLFPTSGYVQILGQVLTSKVFKQVAYIPESPYFPKDLTIQEILHFYARLSGLTTSEIKERIPSVLEVVKLQGNQQKKVRECSKGMMQRISLAQSLLHNPSVLIFDEPTTGLDPLGLIAMREIILFLNSEGKTILFSSHQIAEVEKIAHRVGILVGGELKKTVYCSAWKNESLEKIFMNTVSE